MQTVIYNGKIYADRNRFVEALLIEDGIIVKIGNNEEVLLAAENARLIDCEKRTVIPGFNDSHMHLMNLGYSFACVDLTRSNGIEDLVQRGREFLKNNPDLAEKGLIGRGWNQEFFIDKTRLPDRHDLDRISTRIPIVFVRVCGHQLVTNSKAIELLKLTRESPQYEGGVYDVDEEGSPTGLFAETACHYPCSLIPELSMESKRELFIKAMDHAAMMGITSVQSNDIEDFELQQDLVAMIESVYQDNEAVLRYRFQCGFKDLESFMRILKRKGYRLKRRHEWLKLGPLKLFKDGSLGARTALLRTFYRDDAGNLGVETMDDETLLAFLQVASEHKIQVLTHAIGDGAIENVLDQYQKVCANNNPLRFGIVHCQITDRALLKRIADQAIRVLYQPIFLFSDHHIVDQRVGKKLAATSYAFKSLSRLNARISYGSDCPVESCNPFYNIHAAITRTDLDHNPAGGFYPQEGVDVMSAIDAYTIGSAEVEFMEKTKGRLTEGYLADLVMLDRDIFTVEPGSVKDIKPVLTMVDGEIIYENRGGKPCY